MQQLKTAAINTVLVCMSGVTHAESITRLNPSGLFDTSANGFSQIVIAPSNSKTIYISGQTSMDERYEVKGASIIDQIGFSFTNLKRAIEATGGSPEHTVKLIIYAVYDDEKINDVFQEITKESVNLFGDHKPAMTFIPVLKLAFPNMFFEVEATLSVPDSVPTPKQEL